MNIDAAATEQEFVARVIDAPRLRQIIISEGVLKGDYHVPSTSDLAHLAFKLEELRLIYVFRQRVNAAEEQDRATFVDAMTGMQGALPSLLATSRHWIGMIDRMELIAFPVSQKLIERHEALNELEKILSWIASNCDFRPLRSQTRVVDDWKNYASEIADIFRDAVSATNPKLPRLGNSNAGPVARFLVTAVPLVSMDAPSIDAVAQFLKRAARGTS